jgi:hypothetical protein
MRKSQRKTGGRPFRAGAFLAATAVVAAVGISAPAFASPTAVLQTNTAPIGGGTSIVAGAALSGSFPAASAASVSARLVASTATCPGTYGTSGTAATVTAVSNDDSVTVTVPNVTAGTYKFCFYGVGSGSVTSGTALLTSSDTLTVSVATTKAVLSTPAGQPAGGNTVTATLPGPWITSTAAPGALMTSSACPAAYSTAAGTVALTATKNDAKTVATFTVPTTLTLGTGYNVCFYAGTASTSALIGSSSTTYTTRPALTISPAQGSSATVTPISIGSSTTANFLSTSTTPGVVLTRTACPATYDATGGIAATNIAKISNFKLTAKVPVGVALLSGEATAVYNVCVYADATSGALVGAPTTYTIAPTLAVTGVDSTTTGGPAQGGSSVIIVGSGFPTDPTATLSAAFGGSPVTITSVSSDGTKIFGTTTAHAPGAVQATVTTAAGSKTASGTAFTFSYGITISPNTAPSPASTSPFYLDILGAGFDSLTPTDSTTWDFTTAVTANPHVFLLSNAGYTVPNASSAYWTSGQQPVTECVNIIKISDGELICTLDLYKITDFTTAALVTGPVPDGVYRIAVVGKGGSTGSNTAGVITGVSTVTSGSTFTVASY